MRLIFLILYLGLAFNSISQNPFENTRLYTVAIGEVVNSHSFASGFPLIKKFNSIGSGLVTYVRFEGNIFKVIVTARHVLKEFEKNKKDSIYIRFSWADSIKTTAYFGVAIPRFVSKAYPTVYYHPDSTIDLGCIVTPDNLLVDETIARYYSDTLRRPLVFPYNSMNVPETGEQVWIYGYPSHIELNFQHEFDYCITTFKPGYVTWKSKGKTNSLLDKIILVESNASFGNSGGPVFAMRERLELVGILIGGYNEPSILKILDKDVVDAVSKTNPYIQVRSGVSIITKAEFVKELLLHVEKELLKPPK